MIRTDNIVFILLTAFVIVMAWLFKRNRTALDGLKAVASPVVAKAIILDVTETGIVRNQFPQVKIQVHVMPDKGRNFVVEIKDVLSPPELQLLRNGHTVTVAFNPRDVREMVLVKPV